jgi:hypothetical protein
VRRYGQVIGAATQPIPRGCPCACPQSGDVAIARRTRVARRLAAQRAAAQLSRVSAPEPARGRTQLYRRPHQRELFGDRGAPHRRSGGENRLLARYENVDGVVAITHTSGCGMAGEGEGFELWRRTLWGTAASPNFGAVLLVGLGCEVLQINRMKAEYGIERVYVLHYPGNRRHASRDRRGTGPPASAAAAG